jgi:hypothetical protein
MIGCRQLPSVETIERRNQRSCECLSDGKTLPTGCAKMSMYYFRLP